MKKWLLYALIAVLGVTTIYGFAFSIVTKVGEQTKLNEIDTSAQTRVAYAQNLSATQAAEARATLTAAESQNQASYSTLASQNQATIEAMQSQFQATLTVMNTENAAKAEILKNAVRCENSTSKIDYSDNATVSLSLKAWLEGSVGKISDRNWETFWYNSHTAKHTLTGKNKYIFIVYFKEPALGFTNAVFNVNKMCWLDLQ